MSVEVKVKLSPEQQQMAAQGTPATALGFSATLSEQIDLFRPYDGMKYEDEYLVLRMAHT